MKGHRFDVSHAIAPDASASSVSWPSIVPLSLALIDLVDAQALEAADRKERRGPNCIDVIERERPLTHFGRLNSVRDESSGTVRVESTTSVLTHDIPIRFGLALRLLTQIEAPAW